VHVISSIVSRTTLTSISLGMDTTVAACGHRERAEVADVALGDERAANRSGESMCLADLPLRIHRPPPDDLIQHFSTHQKAVCAWGCLGPPGHLIGLACALKSLSTREFREIGMEPRIAGFCSRGL
jgi:hypothetical protein